jgi:hypothetical protein
LYDPAVALSRLPAGTNNRELLRCLDAFERACGGQIVAMPDAELLLIGLGWQKETCASAMFPRVIWLDYDRAFVIDPKDQTCWHWHYYSEVNGDADHVLSRIFHAANPLSAALHYLVATTWHRTADYRRRGALIDSGLAGVRLDGLSDCFAECWLSPDAIVLRRLTDVREGEDLEICCRTVNARSFEVGFPDDDF